MEQKVISFPSLDPIEAFKRQIQNCPYKTSTLRGAVSTLKGCNTVFFLWESEDPTNKNDGKMTSQIPISFQEAESVFLMILSELGSAKWQCDNSASVYHFWNAMNDTIAQIQKNQGIALPKKLHFKRA